MMKRKLKNAAMKYSMYLCGFFVVAVLVFTIGYILYRGIPGLSLGFITGQTSYITGKIGILPNILFTFYIVIVTLSAAVPLGIGCAVYLTEYSHGGRIGDMIGFAVNTLTGIPSVIFGLVGMLFFTQIMGLKQGILAGGLTLAMMVLPTVIVNTKESLEAVPDELREGALALGSTKWHMIRTVVLPCAADGILTGCILSVGRIMGESAALLFTAGFGMKLAGFIGSLTSSSATLTVALYMYASEQGKFDTAYSIAVVLLVLTLIFSKLLPWAVKKTKGRKNG